MLRAKRIRGRAVGLLLAASCLLGPGCVGYLTGSYDAEVMRLRNIVAELEARNAALAEECIDLRKRVREQEEVGTSTGLPASDSGLPDT